MVMVGSIRQMDDPRTMPEMNMVQPPEFLEYVERPVDGGLIDFDAGPGRRPGLDIYRRQMLSVAVRQDRTNRPSSTRDAKPGGPQSTDEVVGRNLHIASRRPIRRCG